MFSWNKMANADQSHGDDDDGGGDDDDNNMSLDDTTNQTGGKFSVQPYPSTEEFPVLLPSKTKALRKSKRQHALLSDTNKSDSCTQKRTRRNKLDKTNFQNQNSVTVNNISVDGAINKTKDFSQTGDKVPVQPFPSVEKLQSLQSPKSRKNKNSKPHHIPPSNCSNSSYFSQKRTRKNCKSDKLHTTQNYNSEACDDSIPMNNAINQMQIFGKSNVKSLDTLGFKPPSLKKSKKHPQLSCHNNLRNKVNPKSSVICDDFQNQNSENDDMIINNETNQTELFLQSIETFSPQLCSNATKSKPVSVKNFEKRFSAKRLLSQPSQNEGNSSKKRTTHIPDYFPSLNPKNSNGLGHIPKESNELSPLVVNSTKSSEHRTESISSGVNEGGSVTSDQAKVSEMLTSGNVTNLRNSKDKVSVLKELRKQYNSIMNSIAPVEMIMDYRSQFDKMASDCTKPNLNRIKTLQSLIQEQKAHSHIFKLQCENLLLQQKCFDDFINSMKHKFFVMNGNDDNSNYNMNDIIKKGDKIKRVIQNECNLFQKQLPAYAYKADILKALKDNQVLIISADTSYIFNVVTPVIVLSGFRGYSVVSCESSDISSKWIRYDIESLIKPSIGSFSSIDFMESEKMLSCLKNSESSGKNCFVLNLPLKRSVTSDLLLAALKEKLTKQKDSKLVLLLSAFDTAEKYRQYFFSLQVFLLEVPKLLFPVQTVWKNEPFVSKNCKKDVIKTALSIHALNGPGDVMAFLPSLIDAKAANAMLIKKIQQLKYDNLECILVHEGSTNILDFKKPLNHGKRRIFITTHYMEAIHIPSVLYVIDCGALQNYMFDNNKQLDVLSTVFVSRARARLRKSLVGVYNATGVCYRIFNKENFCNDMPSYEIPDVLTLNPFSALLNIFRHYSGKAFSLSLVEPLDHTIQCATFKQMKLFNAVKDGKVTQLGEKICKLPFSARHSKLILQGIQWDFAFEVIILVAYFSIDSYLFKFTEDDKCQQDIDANKLDLIQHESDALSFLYIYKCWTDNNYSTEWCDKFHINIDFLKGVKTEITEICQILHKNLNLNIIQKFSDQKNSYTVLLEILFQCFFDNLCVFSGHDRCGYVILSSNKTACIHSSSIICHKENLPQFIIYNKIVTTGRHFLLGITAIPTDFVKKSFEEGFFDFDYSDVLEKTLVSETLKPVGERIIKEVLIGVEGKKLEEIERFIKIAVNSDFIVVDPCAEKGCATVYALKPVLEDAVNIVSKMLESTLNDVINAEKTYILELKKGVMVVPLKVKCVMGAKMTSAEVQDNILPFPPNNSHRLVSEPIEDNISSIKQSIDLTWIRRTCSGTCHVNFAPESFAQARKLAMKNILVLQSEVWVEVSLKNDAQLILSELPRETRPNDVEKALKACLPDAIITKIELKFDKPYRTTLKDIETIKSEIKKLCDNCSNLIEFDVTVPSPKDTATIMTAHIDVFRCTDLTDAAKKLSNATIRNFKVNAVPIYKSVVTVHFKLFKALKSRIKEEIEKLKHDLIKMNEQNPGKGLFRFEVGHMPDSSFVYFNLLSNDATNLRLLHKTVNELLEGEVLSKNQVKDIHKLFCHGGHIWLRALEKSKKVHILEEYNSKNIRVYGSLESCFKVKESILKFLQDTESEAVETIILSNDKANRILMKSLIKKYSVNLEPFIEECELRSAELDIKTCRLLLHGSRDSIGKAKEVLNSLSSELDSAEELSGGELCPVCACPALNLTIRLQHCGHLYCNDCMSNLVEQAQIPIQCCAENCSKDIVLDDIEKVLDEDDAKMERLLRASLNDYLERNRDEIFCCPAPDCSMFGRNSEVTNEAEWFCTLCLNEICYNCNVIYHYGLTCDMYQGSKQDPDYSFKIWKNYNKQCKNCPKCKTAIEKNKGCNHMICISCKTHFCWLCTQAFPTEDAAYEHMLDCDQNVNGEGNEVIIESSEDEDDDVHEIAAALTFDIINDVDDDDDAISDSDYDVDSDIIEHDDDANTDIDHVDDIDTDVDHGDDLDTDDDINADDIFNITDDSDDYQYNDDMQDGLSDVNAEDTDSDYDDFHMHNDFFDDGDVNDEVIHNDLFDDGDVNDEVIHNDLFDDGDVNDEVIHDDYNDGIDFDHGEDNFGIVGNEDDDTDDDDCFHGNIGSLDDANKDDSCRDDANEGNCCTIDNDEDLYDNATDDDIYCCGGGDDNDDDDTEIY